MSKRYIDADETKAMLREYCIDGDEDAEYWFDFMGIEDCIDNTVNTADVRENVRGEWQEKYWIDGLGNKYDFPFGIACSKCHYDIWVGESYDKGNIERAKTNFCPNCGAWMGTEEDDDN